MKKILTTLLAVGLVSAAFANHPGKPGKRPGQRKGKKAAVVVRGEKAKTIYDALNATETTVTIRNKKFDKKSVSSLNCFKKLASEKAKVKGPKYRCVLKGKKVGKRVGRRGHRRGHGRGHGRGHRRNRK